MANVPKRRVVVVHPSVNETSTDGRRRKWNGP